MIAGTEQVDDDITTLSEINVMQEQSPHDAKG